MSARVRTVLLIVGGLLYAWVLSHIGLRTIIADLGEAGLMLVPVVALYLVVYTLNAVAMQLILAVEPTRPPVARTLSIIISGFGVNYITPVISAGGEPLRVLALEPWVGRQRAVGAVVLYNMFHALSSIVWWLSGLVFAFFLVPLTPLRLTALGGATVIVVGLGLVLLALHREGLFLRILKLFRRVPAFRARLERWHDATALLDSHIREFYHAHPRRFIGAVVAEVLSRAALVAELILIGKGVGIDLSYPHAAALSGLGALAINATFFIPFGLGSKEASWMAIYPLLGSTAEFGVYASVVNRLMELIWSGIGLLLLVVVPARRVVVKE